MTTAKRFQDRLLLLAVALIASIGAWVFWSQLAEHSFAVFSSIVIITLAMWNRELRARVRALSRSKP